MIPWFMQSDAGLRHAICSFVDAPLQHVIASASQKLSIDFF